MENKDYQAAYRKRQLEMGRRSRLYYLTDEEKAELDKRLSEMRKKEPAE